MLSLQILRNVIGFFFLQTGSSSEMRGNGAFAWSFVHLVTGAAGQFVSDSVSEAVGIWRITLGSSPDFVSMPRGGYVRVCIYACMQLCTLAERVGAHADYGQGTGRGYFLVCMAHPALTTERNSRYGLYTETLDLTNQSR